MSRTKNAMLRYQVLDRCFRNTGRGYTLDDLLEACNEALYNYSGKEDGIHRRQLQKDIQFMESEQGWSIPLERIRFGEKNQKMYLRYEDPKFSINNQPLNRTEAEQLKSALFVLSRFTGTPQFEWVNEIIPVIENKLGLVGKGEKVIAFDSNMDAEGLQHIQPIFNAITNRTVLKIRYQDFKTGEPYEFLYHPYYLKQYNNRWFAFGLNSNNSNPTWNLALDRIKFIEQTSSDYIGTTTDWEDYFYDIVGVTKPQDKALEKVVLQFNSEQAPYVQTKPLHPSQKSKMHENYLEVQLQIIVNFELERILLSYGDGVKVILPENLKKQIKELHYRAYSGYLE
jgi:predicted DNA-binding transcriptional regulator YafY